MAVAEKLLKKQRQRNIGYNDKGEQVMILKEDCLNNIVSTTYRYTQKSE